MANMEQGKLDQMIRVHVRYWLVKIPDLNGAAGEDDFVQDVYVKFIRFNYLESFDEDKSSLNYYISRGVKQVMLDAWRCRRYRRTVGNGAAMIDGAGREVNLDERIYLRQVLSELESKSTPGGVWQDTPLGRVQLSEYSVLLLKIHEFSKAEISRFMDISVPMVNKYLRRAFILLSGIMQH